MALEDEDRAWIAEQIKTSQPKPAPTAKPAGRRQLTDDEYDGMSPRDQTKVVRSIVQEELAALDAEAERQDLRAENEALRQEIADVKKGKTPKPRTEKPGEQAPTVFSKFYGWMFGNVETPGGQQR